MRSWLLNLKLKNKMLALTLVVLLFFMLVQITVSIYLVKKESGQDIDRFRVEQTESNKKLLRNYVDMAWSTVEANYLASQDRKSLENRYGESLKGIIDTAASVVEDKISLWRSGLLTLDEAKQQSLQIIKKIRYNNGTGYIWINDTTLPYPTMIMHPMIPSLDGTVLSDSAYDGAYGRKKNLFQAFVEVCNEKGEGFIDYLWSKPAGENLLREQPKLSYVRLIRDWNWILGTGIYVNDAVEQAKRTSIEMIRKMRYDNGEGYLWIQDTTLPYPIMIMHPILPSLEGKNSNIPLFNQARNPSWSSEEGKNSGIPSSETAKDKNVVQLFSELCLRSGEGYIEYLWPKPGKDGLTPEDQPKMTYVKLFKPWGWVIGTGFYISIDEEVRKKEALADSQITQISLTLFGASVLLAIAVSGLIYTYSGYILKPLRRMGEVTEDVSKGDLTQKVATTSKDEIGQMSEHFNTLISNFDTLIRTLRETTRVLIDSVHHLSSSSQEISATSNQQAAAVKEIVSTMEDTDELSRSMAVRIGEVSKIANKTKETVESGFSAIKHTLEKMDEIRTSNSERIKGIKSLGDGIQNVWEIVNIINTIADQTKVIAFNAELEAASAGDAGKNFKIVASEIRRLADSTVDSTREIKSMINEIQRSSDSLILASEEGTQKISEGWELTYKLGQSFEDILSSAEKTADSGSHIATSVNQQVYAFEQILLTLKQISEGVDNFVISMKATANICEKLKETANSLHSIINKYRVNEDGIEVKNE